jgi:hypothetical protein
MDKRSIAMGLGCLLMVVGCDHTRWNLFKPADTPPPSSNKVPTAEQLTQYLNDNAARVQNFRCDNLSITASQGLQAVGMTGKIWLEKDKNLRLVADAGGNREFDMGSNEQEFWFWVARMKPSYQFYCAYKDIKEARNMPIPFQPDWMMEAIGLGQYGPAGKYKIEHDNETIRLVEKTSSPQGTPLRKVIVFNRRPVQAPNPQMLACQLFDDATNKEIGSVKILETQLVGKDNGIMPKRLELQMNQPDAKVKMVMVLNGATVNQVLPMEAFRRPAGQQGFDLAKGRPDGQAGVQRLRGQE